MEDTYKAVEDGRSGKGMAQVLTESHAVGFGFDRENY